MSRKALETKLVRKLQTQSKRTEGRIASEISREILESKKVNQCLIVTKKALSVLHAGMEAATDSNINLNHYTQYVRDKLALQQLPWPSTDNGIEYFEKLLKRHGLYPEKTIMYFGGSFIKLKEIIRDINETYVVDVMKKDPHDAYDAKTFGNTVNLDHGIAGASTASLGGISTAMSIGTRISKVDPEKFKKLANSNYDEILNEHLSEFTTKALRSLRTSGHKLLTNWENIINTNTGKITANLSVAVKPVTKQQNLDLAVIEKKEYDLLMEAIARALVDVDYLNLEGSSTPKNKIAKVILADNLAAAIKGKKKVSIEPKIKSAGTRTKTSVSKNIKGAKGAAGTRNVQSMGQARDSKGRFVSKKKVVSTAVSAISLHNLINRKLPKYVADNMGSPRLNYISGRFANSARVTSVRLAKTGTPTIDYTYMLYPYQTFEPGFAQGSTYRDPRSIIGLSIRQIAAELKIDRLNVRRV